MIDLARDLLTQLGVDHAAAESLAEMLRLQPARLIEAEVVLCEEGDAGDKMWVLVEGAIVVRKQDLGGFPRRIARIEAPAMLGHMALAGGTVRSASCVAEGELRVLVIDADAFAALMSETGPTGDAFRRLLIAGMTRQLAQGNSELRNWLKPGPEDEPTEQVSDLLSLHATFDGWVG